MTSILIPRGSEKVNIPAFRKLSNFINMGGHIVCMHVYVPRFRPIFHQNANPFALGPHVGLDPHCPYQQVGIQKPSQTQCKLSWTQCKPSWTQCKLSWTQYTSWWIWSGLGTQGLCSHWACPCHVICHLFVCIEYPTQLSKGKPTRMRRLCLKNFEAAGRGGLGITSSSEELML